jgi:cytochrome c556
MIKETIIKRKCPVCHKILMEYSDKLSSMKISKMANMRIMRKEIGVWKFFPTDSENGEEEYLCIECLEKVWKEFEGFKGSHLEFFKELRLK